MEAPFIFGKIAENENFTDRERETDHLVTNFRSLINTIIISPRRWGKSSLVSKASDIALKSDNKLRICHIDLFNVRDEAEFYKNFANVVISSTASKWEEAVENAKKFFSGLIPKISIGTDPSNEVSIDFDWEEVSRSPDEILDLPDRISKEKGLRIVVCIDEFQNIAEFDEPDYFQKKLRSHWQRHQKVSYCLYGSKLNMMTKIFTDASKPFYKFGDMMFLDKIDTPHLVDFICRRFRETGKKITPEASHLIVSLTENHPYYTQQLAQLSWLRTNVECSEEIVRQAHSGLVEQLSLLFVSITDTLTSQQLNFLKALINGEKAISSAETMHRYRLSSATSVMRSKETLLKKDILDNRAGVWSIQDPIYSYWLRTQYFR